MSYTKVRWLPLLAISLTTIIACSSGGETGTGGAPTDKQQTTIGAIKGFGSVHVNGIAYNTDVNTQVTINNNNDSETNLSHGMVVTLRGTVNADGTTGSASSIEYNQNILGVVFGNTLNTPGGNLDVLGFAVKTDIDTVFETNDKTIVSLPTIPVGALVEISGYPLTNGQIHASRIAVKSVVYTNGVLNIKATIASIDIDVTQIPLLGSSLKIDSDSSTQYEPNGLQLAPDMIVSMDITPATPTLSPDINTDFIAQKIESYTPDEMTFDDGDEVEIEGVVTSNYDDLTKSFGLNNIKVVVNDNTEGCGTDKAFGNIMSGVKLEVEGMFNSANELVADGISCREVATIEIEANVNDTDQSSKQFWIMGEPVLVTSLTTMKDESSASAENKDFSLAQMQMGDRVDIDAYLDTTTSQMVASSVIRINSIGDASFNFTGPVTSSVLNSGDPTIVDSINAASFTFDVSTVTPKVTAQDLQKGPVNITGFFNSMNNIEVNTVSFD